LIYVYFNKGKESNPTKEDTMAQARFEVGQTYTGSEMVCFEIGKTYVYKKSSSGMKLTWTVISRTTGTVTIKNHCFGEIKRNIIRLDGVSNEKIEAVKIFKRDKFSVMSACNKEHI
jgi:hypothetical protein